MQSVRLFTWLTRRLNDGWNSNRDRPRQRAVHLTFTVLHEAKDPRRNRGLHPRAFYCLCAWGGGSWHRRTKTLGSSIRRQLQRSLDSLKERIVEMFSDR